MAASQVTIDARAAAAAMANAEESIGNPINIMRLAQNNAAYILPLRDAVIAAGKPANDPMVTALNNAHYAASNAIEFTGNYHALSLIETHVGAINAAADFLDNL